MPSAKRYEVARTPAFTALLEDYRGRGWSKIGDDVEWLEGRLGNAPDLMGDQVPGLGHLPLPVFKTRCKDSTYSVGASGGWRVYYAIRKEPPKVFLLFLHHKKEHENPGTRFLLQQMERALSQHPPKPKSSS